MELSGKTAVVTGATSGLGQAVALDLARSGARVFLLGRDPARAAETAARAARAGAEVELALGDLSTGAGVQAVARSIAARSDSVDLLVNCAGGPLRAARLTSEGVEGNFAINALAPFAMERALHPRLSAAHGRVVNVLAGFLDRYPVEPTELPAGLRGSHQQRYRRAKHALLLITVEQSARLAGEAVSAVALDPGVVLGTRLGGGPPRPLERLLAPLWRGAGLAVPIESAVRAFRVACFGEVPPAAYLVAGEPAEPTEQARDPALRAELWALLSRLAGPAA